MEDKGETARKCREYVLSTFLKAPPRKDPGEAADTCGGRPLTRKEMARWAKEHGGPDS